MNDRIYPCKQSVLFPILALALISVSCSSSPRSPEPAKHGAGQGAPRTPVAEGSDKRADELRPAQRIVIPAGTVLRVRLNQAIDTARSHPGDEFTGVLASPVMVDGNPVVPRGASVRGFVQSSQPSGRLKGRASMSVTLRSLEVHETRVELETDSVTRISRDHKKRNLALIGGGSGVGALIGGLAGGGKGALIGAGAGAAAGTAGAAATGRKHVRIPAESVLAFRLQEPVTL